MSAKDTAARLSTEAKEATKNWIMGHAHRGKWQSRGRPPRTLFERLDALHEAYNRKVGLPPGTHSPRGPGAPLQSHHFVQQHNLT